MTSYHYYDVIKVKLHFVSNSTKVSRNSTFLCKQNEAKPNLLASIWKKAIKYLFVFFIVYPEFFLLFLYINMYFN